MLKCVELLNHLNLIFFLHLHFLFNLSWPLNSQIFRSDSEMKEVAAILAREAAEGVATDSLGIRAANLAVKACATAGHDSCVTMCVSQCVCHNVCHHVCHHVSGHVIFILKDVDNIWQWTRIDPGWSTHSVAPLMMLDRRTVVFAIPSGLQSSPCVVQATSWMAR